MHRRILVVEDNQINRVLLCNILSSDYEVLEAENGIEALAILRAEHATLSAVVLDLIMPLMDGFEVLEQMGQDESLKQIPVIVTTGDDEKGTESRALKAGALDYVTKPYIPDILLNRLHNTINMREQAAIVNATRVDALTGLYSRSAFFDKAAELVAAHDTGFYVMACFDIEKFRVINDQYGNSKGDQVLKGIAQIFKAGFGKVQGICSRIMADNFAVLYPSDFMESEDIAEIRRKAAVLDGTMQPITFSVGRYVIEDCSLEPSAMYDRAVMAKESIKGRYDEHVALYDESMRKHILQEQEIIGEMSTALKNGQFEVWYQPQFNHATGALIGAEALVRWRHPAKGLISPGVFIPIFEKNGFVYEVDRFVWEQSCIFLQEMKRKGRLIPISVNISRYDIFREDLVDYIKGLVEKYEIPVDALRLEITESAFATSGQQIIQVVKQFKQLGFTMEIDDFGCGYSSLNTLKDVPADVLKLDMRFLEGEENTEKGGSILESIIRMARWIGMSVIAEGVEEIEQADFLKSVGCNYVQGYLYSKPLPKAEYEKILSERRLEGKMASVETIESYNSGVFWNPKSIETLIFNSFVGGACVFEYVNGKIEIIRVNDKYVSILCGDCEENLNVTHLEWEKHLSPQFLKNTTAAMKRAIKTGKQVTDEVKVESFLFEGKSLYIQVKMRVIAHTGNRYLFYCILEDVTAQREAILEEQESAAMMQLILKNVGCGIVATILKDGHAEYLFANEQYYAVLGYTREQFHAEVMDPYATIHPEDKAKIFNQVNNLGPDNRPVVMEYRAVCRNGETKWLRTVSVNTKSKKDGQRIQLSVFNDISEEVLAETKRKELFENLPCGAGIYEFTKGKLKSIYANQKYWELVGRQPYHINDSTAMDFIQLEDRAYLIRTIQEAILHGGRQEGELHILHGNGKYVPFQVYGNIMQQGNGKMTIYAIYIPITENSVTFRKMLPVAVETMMASSTDFAFIKDRTLQYVCASRAFAQMAGYPDEKQIIGKSDYDLFEKGWAEKYRADDQQLLADRKNLIDYVESIPDLDGTPRYSCTSKYVLKDSFGQPIGIYGLGRDITESKDAFERLKLLTDNIPGGLAKYELSPRGIKRLYLSAGVYQITGYSPEDNRDEYDDSLRLVFKEDQLELLRQINELINHETPLDCDLRIRQKTGNIKWIHMRGTESGRVENIVIVNAFLFDITIQKNAEIKLKEMGQENRNRYEHELQLRNELIRDSILYYQINLRSGLIEEYHSRYDDNSHMKRGIIVDDSIRHELLEKVKQEDKEYVNSHVFLPAVQKAYKRGNKALQYTYRRKTPDGTYHWVQMDISLMEKPENGDAVAFYCCKDVDRERKLKLAIETILNADMESVLVADTRSKLVSIAHMRKNLAGINVDEDFYLEEKFKEFLITLVKDEDKESFERFFRMESLMEALEKTQMTSLTYQILEEGTYRRKISRAYYLDDTRDVIILTRRDITQLYEDEQTQKLELRTALDLANKANHAKTDFLSRMSHDIRTPLNAVLAFSNREMTEGVGEKKLREYLEKINISGEYLLGIINDVLDMSKIEQKKIILKPEPYLLSEFIDTVHNMIDEFCEEKNIEFVVSAEQAGVQGIMADRVRFNQIFINLLSNAVKFTQRGGRIELILQEKQDEAGNGIRKLITVRDNGIGMTEDFIPHAFESFNQEYRKETSERNQGTGLGLAIVKELVDLMKGTISLESKVNSGTTFTVELPFENSGIFEQRQEKANRDFTVLCGMHILLVEDNFINMEIAVAFLEKYGCILDCAENGEEACEKFEASEPFYYQLILMDIRMPVMDGLTASRKIRSMKRADAQAVPIVAMTADAFDEDERIAFKAGMNEHLPKPIEPQRLYELCSKMLKKN